MSIDTSGPVQIRALAPARIDLAGGTLDLWPLYLFVKQAKTINLGIDLFAEAELSQDPVNSAGEAGVILKSDDQKAELALGWGEIPTVTLPPQLQLHGKLLQFFVESGIESGRIHRAELDRVKLTVKTRARSPAGAGLGGSSTLGIALSGAFHAWLSAKTRVSALDIGDSLVATMRDIETRILGVPAGVQDYFGAVFGGLQTLEWKVGTQTRYAFPEEILRALEKRLMLFYSGHSRNSGINNWILYKSLIDRQHGIQDKFSAIAEASLALELALHKEDWRAAQAAIAMEWQSRQTLASTIATPAMKQAFGILARHGFEAWKVCGAGGGGCFFAFHPDLPDSLRDTVCSEMAPLQIKQLQFNAVSHGLQIESSLWKSN